MDGATATTTHPQGQHWKEGRVANATQDQDPHAAAVSA